MIGEKIEVKKIIKLLGKALKLERNSLCFCGSGKKFKNCCGSNTDDANLFIEKTIILAKAYRESKKEDIKMIPRGIWNKAQNSSLSRLLCIFPNCRQKTVNCHLVPENVLRLNYGGHCNEYAIDDDSGELQFVRKGIVNAATLPVFCSQHDHDIFNKIDLSDGIDFSSKEHLFLFAFKILSFSFRKAQCLLGIDSQVEIVKPYLIQERQKLPNGTHVNLDISNLRQSYTKFSLMHSLFKDSLDAYNKKNWDFFYYSYRRIKCTKPVFFGSLFSPSHDLHKKKINIFNIATTILCNFFSKDQYLNLLFACPNKLDKKVYQGFFDQIQQVNEETLLTVINNLLTLLPDFILMPEGFSLSSGDQQKIKDISKLAGESLKSASVILDLEDRNQAVKFL